MSNSQPIVIIGGGLTAARAIEAIREADQETPVVLVAKENRLPYERPPLSKGVMLGNDPEDVAFTHPREWYDDNHVDLRLGVAADRLDPAGRTLTLSDGSELGYGSVLIATGSGLRKLDVPGTDLADVFYLRSMTDSEKIRARLVAGSDVVIIGAGWIGLEVAAAARHHGAEVTIIEPQPAPLFGVVGEQIGTWFADLHRSHGVTLRLGEGVERLEGEDGKVTTVVTSSGERLPADTVVIGVGIRPNTRLAEDAGLEVDNGVVVDESLRASAEGVYAAGDVANWYNPTLGTRLRVEHWANAQDGGYAAGQSIVGKDVHYGPIPFFFSDQYDVGLEYAGHVPRDTEAEVVLRGDPKSNEFMAFWVVPEGSGVRVLAGMHVNVWDTMDAVQALIRGRTAVDRARLADPGVALTDLASA
ncbi:MAG TPA: FAD/NAD(P)-binding oxidoreductase [Intrasporangium sp.]|uniref:NAD(P)/FAD-dependent oxidoreductase n=1 Tax=Intrasporangium sp. TaxID=1925024 RepID=UPI002B468EF3|nr:FAD/NAD(P)-binding oxidoreductase [Intrasporangium sp.]HKX68441.1 FAD/NAD(P)-binding oxidoreductase [Intrasporangium sp.]